MLGRRRFVASHSSDGVELIDTRGRPAAMLPLREAEGGSQFIGGAVWADLNRDGSLDRLQVCMVEQQGSARIRAQWNRVQLLWHSSTFFTLVCLVHGVRLIEMLRLTVV